MTFGFCVISCLKGNGSLFVILLECDKVSIFIVILHIWLRCNLMRSCRVEAGCICSTREVPSACSSDHILLKRRNFLFFCLSILSLFSYFSQFFWHSHCFRPFNIIEHNYLLFIHIHQARNQLLFFLLSGSALYFWFFSPASLWCGKLFFPSFSIRIPPCMTPSVFLFPESLTYLFSLYFLDFLHNSTKIPNLMRFHCTPSQ